MLFFSDVLMCLRQDSWRSSEWDDNWQSTPRYGDGKGKSKSKDSAPNGKGKGKEGKCAACSQRTLFSTEFKAGQDKQSVRQFSSKSSVQCIDTSSAKHI